MKTQFRLEFLSNFQFLEFTEFFFLLDFRIQDPRDGKNGIPVPILIDSTTIKISKSSDRKRQQRTFFKKDSGKSYHFMLNYCVSTQTVFTLISAHLVRGTNCCTVSGEIVFSSCFSSSNVPRHGDNVINAKFLGNSLSQFR